MMESSNKQDNEDIHRTISPSRLCEPEHFSGPMDSVEIDMHNSSAQNVAQSSALIQNFQVEWHDIHSIAE